jgi:CcmD family protein
MSSPVTAGWGYVAGGYGAIGALVAGYVVSVLRRRRSLTRRLRPTPAEPALDHRPSTATVEEVP